MKWDPELQTTYNTGETKDRLEVFILWHVELMVTRALPGRARLALWRQHHAAAVRAHDLASGRDGGVEVLTDM